MTYREYVREMKAVAEKNGYTASIREMNKPNACYKGLLVMKPSGKSGVMLDLHDSYRQYEQGGNLQVLQESLMSIIRDKMSVTPEPSDFAALDIRSENLFAEAVNTERNAEYLSHVPHTEICDLSIIFRASIAIGDETGSTVITDDLLKIKACGMTGEGILSSVLGDIKKHRPYKVNRMFDMLNGMGMDMPQNNCDEQLLVVTTEDGCMGAGVIGYPGFLTECAERYGSYYLLPSSIHELLLIPAAKDSIQMDDLYQMVCDINSAVLSTKDFLSNNVYHFDDEDSVLTDYFGRVYRAN